MSRGDDRESRRRDRCSGERLEVLPGDRQVREELGLQRRCPSHPCSRRLPAEPSDATRRSRTTSYFAASARIDGFRRSSRPRKRGIAPFSSQGSSPAGETCLDTSHAARYTALPLRLLFLATAGFWK